MTVRDAFGRYLPTNPDPFDPRFLPDFSAPRTITLDRAGDEFCLVSAEDFDDLRDMGWQLHNDGHGKLYVRASYLEHGQRMRPYMHRVVASRFLTQPSPLHFLVDHKNSNELHNQRPNLRYATPGENSKNRFGFYWRQLSLFGGAA